MTETRKFVALSRVFIFCSENSLGSKFCGACFNLGWMQVFFGELQKLTVVT